MVVDNLAQSVSIIMVSVALIAYGLHIQRVAKDTAAKIVLTAYREAILKLIQKYADEAKDSTLSSSEQERRWAMSCGARNALQVILDLEQQQRRS